MSWVLPTLIIAAMGAAIVFRRRMKDPQNPLGVWLAENLRPRMAFAAKVGAYLTLAVWILIFAFAPKDERGSFGDLMWRALSHLDMPKDQPVERLTLAARE